VTGLPKLTGSPIQISFKSQLSAHRGKLLATEPYKGTPVYGACFIKERRIVLESGLTNRPSLLRLIVVHELFHFVWRRLGNRTREQFAELLAYEYEHRARGELGESAAVKKALLRRSDYESSSGSWRDYVCESFCDTAAWHYSGITKDPTFTLAQSWRERRRAWIETNFAKGYNC